MARNAARSLPWLVVRVLTAAGLAVDAYVHADLASQFDANGTDISQGTLFRIEAAAASVAALLVLLALHRLVDLLVFLIAASALGAVLLYRYVDVGTLGPLADMYDPVWYTEKTVSAIAEAVATLGAALLVVAPSYRRRPRHARVV